MKQGRRAPLAVRAALLACDDEGRTEGRVSECITQRIDTDGWARARLRRGLTTSATEDRASRAAVLDSRWVIGCIHGHPMSGSPVSKRRQAIERRHTACHEAAHAVARYLIRPRAYGEEVTIVPTKTSRGHHCSESWLESAIQIDPISGKQVYNSEEIDNCIVQMLVGRFADRRAGCPIRLSKIAAMGDDERIVGCVVHAGSKLVDLRRRAAQFVQRHWKAISAVAHELLERETLQADEVEAIVDFLDRPAETRRQLALLRTDYERQAIARQKLTDEHIRRLTKNEALALVKQHGEALTRHLDQHCVGIVGFTSDSPELGSGTCVTIGGRFFIATAAHVISAYSDAELFLVHTRTPDMKHTPILGRGSRGGGDADPQDVAWLEVAEPDAVGLGKSFVAGNRLEGSVTDLPDDNAFIYGYPSEKVDPMLIRERRLRLEPIGYTTPTIPNPTIPPPSRAFDPKYDLCLEYPELGNLISNGDAVRKMPSAPGLSGGGVWATGLKTPGIWSPDSCRLIGIEHGWKRDQYLRCTQIQHWLDLLATDKPELRREIDTILKRS